MRKILSFIMAVLFAGSMWAADPVYSYVPVRDVSATAYDVAYNVTINELDWSIMANLSTAGQVRFGGASLTEVDRPMYTKAAMAYAIDSVVIRHAGRSADKLTVNSVKIEVASDAAFTSILETQTQTPTIAKTTPGTIVFKLTKAAKNSYYRITYNLSNTGTSNYAFMVNSVDFYEKTKTIYLNGGGSSLWNKDAPVFFAHSWGDYNRDAKLEKVLGNVYKAEIPAGNTDILFVSTKTGTTEIVYSGDNLLHKTDDLKLPKDDKNCYTITGLGGADGSWSKYVAPENVTIYFVNDKGWENVKAHVFEGEESFLDWPGGDMTEVGTVLGKKYYSFTFPEVFTGVVFNNGNSGEGNQTDNEKWSAKAPYYCDGKWYPTLLDIPVPAGEWAEVVFTAAASSLDDSTFYAQGREFSFNCTDPNNRMSIDASGRTYGTNAEHTAYAYRLKTGGKSTTEANYLTLTVPADGMLRLATYTGGSGDRKVIVTQNGKEILNEITPSAENEDGYYDYFTTFIQKGTATVTYPSNAIHIYSIAFKELPVKYYITGDSALVKDAADLAKEYAWNAAAIKSFEDSYKLSLKGGVEYKLKVTDGAWSSETETHMNHGYDQLTKKPEGVRKDDDNNICFRIAADGEVTITHTSAKFEIEGDFYIPYYMKNNWDLGAWEWKEMTETETKGLYELRDVIFGSFGVNYSTDPADPDPAVIELKDFGGPGHLGAIPSSLDTVVLYLNTTTNPIQVTADIKGKYVPSVSLVGTMNGWDAAKGKMTLNAAGDTAIYKANLTKGTDTQKDSLKVVFNGKWLSLNGDNDGYYIIHREWDTIRHINGEYKNNFVLDVDVDGEYIFKWAIADSTLIVDFPAEPTYRLDDGFYLISLKNGSFNVDDLTADLKFESANDEFVLKTTLENDQKIKVVEVKKDKIVNWYPDGEGTEYTIDPAHAGEHDVYFKPEYNKDWNEFGGYFWIGENTVKLYLVDRIGWEEVYAYVWKVVNGEDVPLAGWKDQKLELKSSSSQAPAKAPAMKQEGEKIYEYECRMSYDHILFHNGADQTVDLTWEPDKPYFVLEGEKNIDGKYGEGQTWKQDAPTAIENIVVEGAKAVKVLDNGQIFIIKGGKIYNITGQIVK